MTTMSPPKPSAETTPGQAVGISERRFPPPYDTKWPRRLEEYSFKDFHSIDRDDPFDVFKPYGIWWEHCQERGAAYHYGMPMESPPASRVAVRHPTHTQRTDDLINFASYNYLGLSDRREVIEAAVSAMQRYGLGSCGSPRLSGTMDVHRHLEDELARFMGRPAALLFPTGYSANIGVIAGLMRPGDTIVADQLAHASIVDGIRLAGIRPRFFRHNDAADLARRLDRSDGKALVVVEGVYSMEGDTGALTDIVDVCRRHGARVLIDEAHSAFVYGPNGQGVAEDLGVAEHIDIVMGTTSKALGGAGGFIAGSGELIEYLKGYATSWIFSGSMPPAIAGGLLKSLEIVRSEPRLRAKLWSNTALMRRLLQRGGVDTGGSTSHVISIMVGDEWGIHDITDALIRQGVYMNPIRFPAVPLNRSRFRMAISAAHGEDEIEEGARIIISVLGKYGKLRR